MSDAEKPATTFWNVSPSDRILSGWQIHQQSLKCAPPPRPRLTDDEMTARLAPLVRCLRIGEV